jgi:hypothetical protein
MNAQPATGSPALPGLPQRRKVVGWKVVGWKVVTATAAMGVLLLGTALLGSTASAADARALTGGSPTVSPDTTGGESRARPWSGLAGSYATFVPDGSPAASAPTLRFTGFQLATSQFTTLSFEPSRNGTVTPGQWQTWTLGPDSIVWQTNATGAFCQRASPCTLAQFAARYPNGVWGTAQLGLGSGVAGLATGYADAVAIGDGPAGTGTPNAPATAWIGAGVALIGVALLVAVRRQPGRRTADL